MRELCVAPLREEKTLYHVNSVRPALFLKILMVEGGKNIRRIEETELFPEGSGDIK